MRAAVCREYGPPEVVHVEEVPSPEVGPGQVRVRVHVAALNFPDVLLVANQYQMTVPTPFVPGSEFAGVVAEVADDVGSFAVGDAVAGTALVGAFAEEIAVDARSLWKIPEALDERVAAAAGVAHKTAYHVLRSVAGLQPGEQLVVLGAGGGVGSAAVQLGAVMGAEVTAVASSQEKLDVAAERGATHLIDHTQVDLREALRAAVPGGADVVVDPVGGSLAEPALRSLRFDGRFVTVGFAAGDIPRIPLNLVLLKGIHVRGFQFITFATNRPDELQRNEAELAELLASGKVAPHIGATHDLEHTAQALRSLADGQAIGKVLIDTTAEATAEDP